MNYSLLIENHLKNRKPKKVMLTTCKSDWIQLFEGVQQGTVLGPLLFNIDVSSMRKSVTNKCQTQNRESL